MTKKILLKWLEARKAEALAQVDTQETAAKAALLAEKLERTKFAEMVAYVEPRLTEVYNYMMDWHIYRGDRIGQLVVLPVVTPDFVLDLGEARGNGAFGSTGK